MDEMVPIAEKPPKKIKVLAWCDSPTVATGFATVSRNILKSLAKTGKYDIDVIAINYHGDWYDQNIHPYRLYPAKSPLSDDIHGRERLVSALMNKDLTMRGPWDIVFTLNDPFILEIPLSYLNKGTLQVIKEVQALYLEKKPANHFKVISYWPIDSAIKPNWLQSAIDLSDVSVAYTNYGKGEMVKAGKLCTPVIQGLEDRLPVIYHGVDTKMFHPLPAEEVKAFRKEFFQDFIRDDTFVVTVVGRNQPRKDIARCFAIFKEFQKRRPDSYLYIHAKAHDAGGSLLEHANQFGLNVPKDWGYPQTFSENQGYPLEVLNKIYNVSDCVLSTTLGEGFGLPFVEAMAAKVINLSPLNTTVPELFGVPTPNIGETYNNIADRTEDFETWRGLGYKCLSTSSEWTALGAQDYERIRPLGNVDDAVKKLIWIYDNPDKVQKIEENAYNWIQNYDWDIINQQWNLIFEETYQALRKERSKAQQKIDKQTKHQNPVPKGV